MKKSIFITGSTDGIGKLAAIQLAKQGHTIYLHGRNKYKLANTITELKNSSENAQISGFTADFSDLDSVQKMVQQIKKELSKIDVLINNAGIYESPVANTKMGIDIRFVVNYLAPFLLTNELLPLLKKSKSPRIINLSSTAQAPVSLAALEGRETIKTQAAYAQSKLALTMWSFHLAKLHKNNTVIAVNPGSLLNTKMVKEAFGEFWSPAEKGATILYELAISEEFKTNNGQYFDNDKGDKRGTFATAHADSLDANKLENLIVATEKILANFTLTKSV